MRDPVELLLRLEEHPEDFDFYSALRQIECAYPTQPRIGQALRPAQEAVRFGHNLSLAFEASILAGVHRRSEGVTPRLLVNFFGLTASNGPLPIHLTEYIRDRLHHMNDPTPSRFLDIFHHRMISLFYRAWATTQPTVSLDRPLDDRFSNYVGSLIGIGMPSLRERDAIPDYAKLRNAGHLARQCRNADGLAATLGDFFKTPVRVQEFVGHWMKLPADSLSRLHSGSNALVLGMTTVLGKQIWNAQHKFRIVMGPVDAEQLYRLVPNGESMKRLRAWVFQYSGLALDWDVNLIVQKSQVPTLQLGGTARLGWSSWLCSHTPAQDDAQLVIKPYSTSLPEFTSVEESAHA
ncbi:type VI secretion system baseplate subunit TssG [Pseudomonas caspiana]|nr:type VI secretion system baseplate subunit TssG [Pseudomonas caspiana]